MNAETKKSIPDYFRDDAYDPISIEGDLKKLKKADRSPEKLLQNYLQNLENRYEHWEWVNRYGCQDPFYEDGVNLNLTRNHIIFYKKRISTLCEMYGLELPDEQNRPVPEPKENSYMAEENDVNPYQGDRIRKFLRRPKM